jgi:hypothetical protein
MAEILPHHNTLERAALIQAPAEQQIPWGRCHEQLQGFAAREGLFFNKKKLAPDFYGRATLTYEIESEETLHSVRVRITSGSRTFYLDECSWVCPGPPLLFIYGIAFKAAKEYIPPLWLWKLANAPLLLENNQFYRFSNECIDPTDPDFPQVEGCASPEAKKAETILPVLILRDRVGATAQLYLSVEGKKILLEANTPEHLKEPARHWEKDLLETSFTKQRSASGSYYCPIDRVSKSLSFLLECGWHIEDYLGREVIPSTDDPLQATQKGNEIIISGGARFADHESKASDLVGAFNRRETFIQLSNNKVGLLDGSSATNTLAIAAAEGEICGDEIRIPTHRLAALGEQLDEIEGIEALSALLSSAAENFTGLETASPSALFHGGLRPYQQTGVDWLAFLDTAQFGGILADDMGLGKTVQILAYLSRLEEGPSLVVVPRSLLFNWKREIAQFLPGASITIHHGTERGDTAEAFAEADLILTSYGILRRDLPLLQQVAWRAVFLDEAQTIKNPDSLAARAACALNAKLRVAVSGTPIENSLMELWSLFRFALSAVGSSLSTRSGWQQICRRRSKVSRTSIRCFFAPSLATFSRRPLRAPARKASYFSRCAVVRSIHTVCSSFSGRSGAAIALVRRKMKGRTFLCSCWR